MPLAKPPSGHTSSLVSGPEQLIADEMLNHLVREQPHHRIQIFKTPSRTVPLLAALAVGF